MHGGEHQAWGRETTTAVRDLRIEWVHWTGQESFEVHGVVFSVGSWLFDGLISRIPPQ